VNAPRAHGAGRYFDGIASLAMARTTSSYEGQLALQWNSLADDNATSYEFDIDLQRTPWQIDLRPMVRQIVADLRGSIPVTTISARFHNTLATATAAAVCHAARAHARLPVVLTGGCFQNARLAESVRQRLLRRFTVHLHRRVPPGDGGIALGQAVIAATIAKGKGAQSCV
jgi:hydrogenase maturation protein HypF